MYHDVASGDGNQYTKTAIQDLIETVVNLNAVVEEMGKETQVLKNEIQVLRDELVSRKLPLQMHIGEKRDFTLAGVLNMQLDYYPTCCDDLNGNNLPTGIYKTQPITDPSSQQYELCRFD